jgi:RNA polymerase sigma-70 factor (ECF subfamily)
MAEVSQTAQLQALLDRLNAGDDTARAQLLERSLERFRKLTRKYFSKTSRLRRRDETDDVVNKAMIRLHKALTQIHPSSVKTYEGLATRHIRWVLHDLARELARRPIQYTGVWVPGPTPELDGPAAPDGEPSGPAEWAEFHEAIGRLPDEVREVVDALFYGGMTQPEAAELLGVSVATVKRRWVQAQVLLGNALKGEWPTMTE